MVLQPELDFGWPVLFWRRGPGDERARPSVHFHAVAPGSAGISSADSETEQVASWVTLLSRTSVRPDRLPEQSKGKKIYRARSILVIPVFISVTIFFPSNQTNKPGFFRSVERKELPGYVLNQRTQSSSKAQRAVWPLRILFSFKVQPLVQPDGLKGILVLISSMGVMDIHPSSDSGDIRGRIGRARRSGGGRRTGWVPGLSNRSWLI